MIQFVNRMSISQYLCTNISVKVFRTFADNITNHQFFEKRRIVKTYINSIQRTANLKKATNRKIGGVKPWVFNEECQAARSILIVIGSNGTRVFYDDPHKTT